MDTSKFIGLNETAARTLATEAGLQVRVVLDNVPTPLMNDVQMNRITFVVRGGFVVSAIFG